MEKGSAKIAIIVLIILILAAGGFLGYKIVQNKNVQTANEENNENDVLVAGVKQEKEIEIFKGNDKQGATNFREKHKYFPIPAGELNNSSVEQNNLWK